jgi:hypothetical protein
MLKKSGQKESFRGNVIKATRAGDTKKGGQSPELGKGQKIDCPPRASGKKIRWSLESYSSETHFGLLVPRTIR